MSSLYFLYIIILPFKSRMYKAEIPHILIYVQINIYIYNILKNNIIPLYNCIKYNIIYNGLESFKQLRTTKPFPHSHSSALHS